MPRDELKKFLEAAWPRGTVGDSSEGSNSVEIGIGLDCCVKKTAIDNIYLVQTTDFFFPLIENPYIMGKIACANVLSDLFAMGVTRCDNMLMLLGVSIDLIEKERDIIVPMLMKGFSDSAKEAGTSVQGGQSVRNPWMLIGGVATSVISRSEMIPINAAEVGDVLVLTKPLGTRIIGNAFQWYDQKMPRWDKIKHLITPEALVKVYLETAEQMAMLNLKASKMMHENSAHACTDVTGFGILGHAQNLAEFQKNQIDFSIHTLPLINYSLEISKSCEIDFRLLEGFCAETSGGLLVCLPKDKALGFCESLKQSDGSDGCWIIGDVLPGSKTAFIDKNVKVISVSPVYK